MKLWLDDERPMPIGFDVHVKSAWHAIELLKCGHFDEVSLDHDLGDLDGDIGDGYDVACFIEEGARNLAMIKEGALLPILDARCPMIITRLKWNVHSANPVGAEKMRVALRKADEWWQTC